MLLRIRLFFIISLVSFTLHAQQAAVYYKQNEITGIIKSTKLNEGKIAYTNGKAFVIEDELGNMRKQTNISLPGNTLIRDLISINDKIYALYQVISTGGQLQFGVLLLDVDLQIVWYKTFGASGASLSAYSLAADESFCYVVNNNCTNGLSVTKINLSGEVEWNKIWHISSGTIVPEYVIINEDKLLVYSKHTVGNAVSLVVCTLNKSGTLVQSDKYVLSGSFIIKSICQSVNATYVLVNYTSGVVSSEILKLQNGNLKGYLFNTAQALQWNDMVWYNNELYLCGNILSSGNDHLNAVMMCLSENISMLFFKQIESTYNNNLGYDDAMSIVAADATIIVNGINADKGFVLSYNKNYGGICQSTDISYGIIQQSTYTKTTTTLSEGVSPEYNKINTSLEYTEMPLAASDFCNYEIVTSTTGNEPVQTEKLRINVFPNPASELLTIEIVGSHSPLSWEIIDISGRLLKGGINILSKTQVSVSDLPNGLYIMNWKSANERGIVRIVISR